MAEEKLVALMYHRIGTPNNRWERKYCVTPDQFREHMIALSRHRMQAVTIDEYVEWMEGHIALPKNSFLLTFDDGFRGVRDFGLPILEGFKWPATVFLPTDYIGGHDDWTKGDNPDDAASVFIHTLLRIRASPL